MKLIKFKQKSRSSFILNFEKKIKNCYVIFSKTIPVDEEGIESSLINGNKKKVISRNKKLFLDIPFEYESLENEYSYFLVLTFSPSLFNLSLFSNNCHDSYDKTYLIEIIRQTPAWLKKTFDFESDIGYSILGRRTYDPQPKKKYEKLPIKFNNIPQKSFFLNRNVSGYSGELVEIPEILVSSRIINALWAGKADDTPTVKSYSKFISESFEDKLSQIHNTIFPVSCQAIRDMFLHAALAFPEFKVRAINAYNAAPQSSDLIVYSHAATEVFVHGLNQWVLIDPWFGFALRDERGSFLSAEGVACHSGSLDILPLIQRIDFYHLVSGRSVLKASRNPINSKVNEYAFDSSGHVPSYKTYFQHLEYSFTEK